jgi:hypothetical protein
MRATLVASIAAFGLLATASIVEAAPMVQGAAIAVNPAGIIQVRDGCGPGWYRTSWQDRWGRFRSRCVPYRRW